MRPMFMPWSLTVEVELITQLLDREAFTDIVQQAGVIEGLGDGRKIGYGRHHAVVKS